MRALNTRRHYYDSQKAYLDSREVAPLLRVVSRVDVLLEAEEEILEGVEEVVAELVLHRSIVWIDRPSPEALSISPLEAVEEILEEVEDRRNGFWDFHDSCLDCQSACQDHCLNKLGP